MTDRNEKTDADWRQWHWERGTIFALEGIKTAIWLNGAAATALLSFSAQNRNSLTSIVLPVGLFATGAFTAAISLLLAYETQLHYGNQHASPNQGERTKSYNWAWWLHFFGRATFIVAMLFFALGAAIGACKLSSI